MLSEVEIKIGNRDVNERFTKTTTSKKFRMKQRPAVQCLMTHRMCVSVCLHGVSSEARLRSGVMAACRSQGFVQFPIPILHSLSYPLRIYLHRLWTEMRGKDRREVIFALFGAYICGSKASRIR